MGGDLFTQSEVVRIWVANQHTKYQRHKGKSQSDIGKC